METQKISIQDADNKTHQIELQTSSLTLLMSILGELAVGHAVQVIPVHAELTTQEAANILNVSRPHMVKFLEDGKLLFHKTGRHRRVFFADLMRYKDQRDNESCRAMQELADHSQALVLSAVNKQRRIMRKPPKSVDEYLDTLLRRACQKQ